MCVWCVYIYKYILYKVKYSMCNFHITPATPAQTRTHFFLEEYNFITYYFITTDFIYLQFKLKLQLGTHHYHYVYIT